MDGCDVDVVIEVTTITCDPAREGGSQGLRGVTIVDSGSSCDVVFSTGGLIQAALLHSAALIEVVPSTHLDHAAR